MARAAYSLDTLLGQLNALAPGRNKASDGWIGDADHQNRNSDHNPWYPPPNGGIVTARDFTHDPAHGLDCHRVAATLVANGDSRIKYLIWNRRIWTPGVGWRNYTGANPHTSHLHLSVVASAANDSTRPWAGFSTTPPEAPEMELSDKVTSYVWPYTDQTLTVGSTLTNTWSYARQIPKVAEDAAIARANTTTLLGLANGEMTEADYRAVVADELSKIPAAPVDLEAIKAAVRETLAQDNREDDDQLADRIVDGIAARMTN